MPEATSPKKLEKIYYELVISQMKVVTRQVFLSMLGKYIISTNQLRIKIRYHPQGQVF